MLEDVLEKRRLDQALNAKEFAVVAGISYSKAREWFQSDGFPMFGGVVFWSDFVAWRGRRMNEYFLPAIRSSEESEQTPFKYGLSSLPPRAAQILLEA